MSERAWFWLILAAFCAAWASGQPSRDTHRRIQRLQQQDHQIEWSK